MPSIESGCANTRPAWRFVVYTASSPVRRPAITGRAGFPIVWTISWRVLWIRGSTQRDLPRVEAKGKPIGFPQLKPRPIGGIMTGQGSPRRLSLGGGFLMRSRSGPVSAGKPGPEKRNDNDDHPEK